MTVRVRMAPSPTGFFHVGSARTSLYNWFYARQQGGVFVLRIEDTDAERNQEEAVEVIYDALRWLGLDWDELYRQSERAGLYVEAADRLAEGGRTYWCDCTRESVDARAKERGGPPGYDGFCRDRGLAPGEGRAQRFRTPDDGVTVVRDVVRGHPEFRNDTIEDFVIRRSDGSAVFILANVVDDGDMRISHVIRGEDHLPNTPKYLLLWDALGYGDHPVFAHLPMMVNEKRQKLSKRRDPVMLQQYRDDGYLPEVMCNYLALVGWGPKDGREQMSVPEMVEAFRLEDVNNSPGFFDVQKLRAFNGDAIRALPEDEFVARASSYLPEGIDLAPFVAVAPLVQERVAVLSEVWEQISFLYGDAPAVDEQAWVKGMKAGAAEVLDGALELYADVEWRAEELNRVLFEWANERGLKAQAPLRVAVTGQSKGLPLWESLEVLGRERTLERIRAARTRLG